jgi:hypothetical protein
METNPDGTLSLTIEETNKLRISLGMKPLQVDKVEKVEKHIPVQKPEVNDVRSKIEELKWKRRERIKTLGESDSEGEMDTVKWISKQKTTVPVQKKKKDVPQQVIPTTMLLSNDMDEIGDEPIIMTLKDTNVLGDEEDELENVKLKHKRVDDYGYNVYDALENPEMDILAQYDKKEKKKRSIQVEEVAHAPMGGKSVGTVPVMPLIKKKKLNNPMIRLDNQVPILEVKREVPTLSRQKGYEIALEKVAQKSQHLRSISELAKQIKNDDEREGVVFNPTMEFVKTVKVQENVQRRETLRESVEIPSETVSYPVEKEQLVSSGIGATLDYIQDFSEDIPFTLDKFDRFGRVMDPKKAFKEMSHKFHGNKPGKNKLDKETAKYNSSVKHKEKQESFNEHSLQDQLAKSGKAYFELK